MEREPRPGYDWRGLPQGAGAAVSLAGAVMAASFIGFGAFLRSVDFDLAAGLATVPMIWALPGQVVFIDSIDKGLGLAATSLAVSITAVRLMPLTVLVLAKTRVKGAARWPELIAAHFVAITLWLLSNLKIENIPYRRRLPWLIGLGATLCGSMVVFSTLGYFLAERLPVPLAASLVFLTPAFFLVSLLSGIRWRFEYGAVVLGAIIGPLTYRIAPEFDLFIAGIAGGSLAYLLHGLALRFRR
ncbi:MAG TPA: AzlC family ABC transporter permease [Aestuariivirgaceae bacterium]|nr:AzlC family ABC transporter permease [Aestuariivirgaceae bacterium]